MSYASSPIAASAFSDESEVNSQVLLTGLGVTFTPGDPFIEGNAVFLTTGVEASTNLGTAIGEAESIYPLTGEEITSTLGTSVAQAGASASPSGEEITSSTGFLSHTGSAVATPTGLGIQFTEGTITRALEQSFQPGNTFAGAPFASDEIINSEAILVGINSTLALNNVDLVTDNNIQVTPPADQMDTFLGTVVAESESVYPLTGVEITSSTGTANAPASAILTGVESSVNVGTSIAQAGANVAVTGIAMQFADGTPTTTADAVVEPTGLQIQFTEGTVVAPAAVILTGLDLTISLGNRSNDCVGNTYANCVTSLIGVISFHSINFFSLLGINLNRSISKGG